MTFGTAFAATGTRDLRFDIKVSQYWSGPAGKRQTPEKGRLHSCTERIQSVGVKRVTACRAASHPIPLYAKLEPAYRQKEQIKHGNPAQARQFVFLCVLSFCTETCNCCAGNRGAALLRGTRPACRIAHRKRPAHPFKTHMRTRWNKRVSSGLHYHFNGLCRVNALATRRQPGGCH